MGALFSVVLPVFLVLGYGYLAARRGLLSEGAIDGIMRFAQNFALPVLLFQAIAKLDLGQGLDPGLLTAFYVGAFASFAVGWCGARYALRRPPEDCVAIGFVCLFSNTLLLGLPITERAYGADALVGNYAIIAVHSPVLYTFGISVMEFTRARGLQQSAGHVAMRALAGVLRTPLVMGILAGLAANLMMNAGLRLPQALWDAVGMMARTAIPAALFGLGGVLVRYRPTGDPYAVALCCGCALIVHPALTFAIGGALGLDAAALRSAVITAAVAPGVNAYLFASLYGKAQRVAATSLLIGTLACMVTVSAWLAILP